MRPRAGNGAAHRHECLDRQRAALSRARVGPPRSRGRATGRVSIGQRSPARVSQPGHRRHGHQPGRAVRTRRRRAAAAGDSGGRRVAWGRRRRGPRRHEDDARPQGQIGRRGKRRARRLRLEPRPCAQRHAGERRQCGAPRVQRAAEGLRKGLGGWRRHVRPLSRQVPASRRRDPVRQHADSGRDRRPGGSPRERHREAAHGDPGAACRMVQCDGLHEARSQGRGATHGKTPADDRRAVPGSAEGAPRSDPRGESQDARRADAGIGGLRVAGS